MRKMFYNSVLLLTYLSYGFLVMSITEIGANRLLKEDASQTVLLHHEASSQEAINPNKIHCKKGCHIECVPNPFIVECFCQC